MGCLHTFLPSSCYYKKTVWCRGIHPLVFVTNPNSVSLQPKIVTCLDMQSHVCELQKKIKKIKLMVEWLMVHLKTQYFFVYSSLHLLSEHVVLPSFFSGVRVYQSFVVCVVFCWPVFVFFLFVCPLIYGVWLPHWYFLSCNRKKEIILEHIIFLCMYNIITDNLVTTTKIHARKKIPMG
jgi:hypothetical protein